MAVQARMRDEEGFIVRHYAGDVTYHTSKVVQEKTGQAEVPWLEKNNDTLQQEWLTQLVGSKVAVLKELYQVTPRGSRVWLCDGCAMAV